MLFSGRAAENRLDIEGLSGWNRGALGAVKCPLGWKGHSSTFWWQKPWAAGGKQEWCNSWCSVPRGAGRMGADMESFNNTPLFPFSSLYKMALRMVFNPAVVP